MALAPVQADDDPVDETYRLDINDLLDLLEERPHFMSEEQVRREAEDEREALIKSVESIPAPKDASPLSALEWQILCIARKNPHPPGSRQYVGHEIDQAKNVTSQEAGEELINELLNAMADRWRTRAAILKAQFPGANISLPPSGTVDGSCFPQSIRHVHKALSTLRVLQLWHGTSSDIFNQAARTIAAGLDRVPWVFENPLTAFLFVTLLRDIHGAVLPFVSPAERSFLTTESPLLSDPAHLFTCIVSGPVGMYTLKHASAEMRSDARFMRLMRHFYGDAALGAADESLIRNWRAKQAVTAAVRSAIVKKEAEQRARVE